MLCGPAKQAILLADLSSSESDLRMVRLIESWGIPCKTISIESFSHDRLFDGLSPAESGLIVSAKTLQKLIVSDGRERIRDGLNAFSSSFIYGVGPDSLSSDELGYLTYGSIQGYANLKIHDRLTVSDQHREVCGPLSGLTVERPPSGAPVAIVPEPAISMEVLLAVGGHPVFLSLTNGHSRMFISTETEVLSLNEMVNENFDGAAVFEKLVPSALFVRIAFPAACWRPGRNLASLIIDDPLLRKRYGFLNILELLRQLERSRFAANLAFIPWNSRRSCAGVVSQIQNSSRMALCIHGCDHTRAEFGSTNSAWLNSLVQSALERMADHQRRTGLVHQKIMVFPQGIFSSSAMSVLKQRDFLAAVNTEVVPHHQSAARGNVAIGSLLETAMTVYDSFPLFSRRPCTDPVLNYALDLFLGKPCLLVAHHDNFRYGFKPIIDLVNTLNRLAPDLVWTTLGEVLDQSYSMRQSSDGIAAVRLYTNQVTLENRMDSPMKFEITKKEFQCDLIASIRVNDAGVNFNWNEGMLSFSCFLGAGEKARIRIIPRPVPEVRKASPGVRYRLHTAARRYLSEIRDDYVQPIKHFVSAGTTPKKLKRHSPSTTPSLT